MIFTNFALIEYSNATNTMHAFQNSFGILEHKSLHW